MMGNRPYSSGGGGGFSTGPRMDATRIHELREAISTPGPGQYDIPTTLDQRGGKLYSDIRPDEYSDESEDENEGHNDIVFMDNNERVM